MCVRGVGSGSNAMNRLQQLLADRAAGRYTCGKCLCRYQSPRLEYGPQNPWSRSSHCRRCWQEENDRYQEIMDPPPFGCTTSTPTNDEFWAEYAAASRQSTYIPLNAFGLRTDVRWYKKAGGNGDG